MSSAQGSPLLNCTWREIPLNSSWQRQRAGRQIKESQSKRPINTSHSLASLQTPSPWPGLHAPPANPQSWAAWRVRKRRMQVSSWVHVALLHIAERCPSFQLCLVCHTLGVSGALLFFTYTSDVPSGTRCLKLLLKEARSRPTKRKKKKKKRSHVTQNCNINKVACFDLKSLITVKSLTIKSFTNRLQ